MTGYPPALYQLADALRPHHVPYVIENTGGNVMVMFVGKLGISLEAETDDDVPLFAVFRYPHGVWGVDEQGRDFTYEGETVTETATLEEVVEALRSGVLLEEESA